MINRLLITFIIFLSAFSYAEDSERLSVAEEISWLIETVDHSGCTFHRNSSTHSSEIAASHMRLKLSNGKRHAQTTENFIHRLASKSSFTGKLYYIECQPESLVSLENWLTAQLASLRNNEGY